MVSETTANPLGAGSKPAGVHSARIAIPPATPGRLGHPEIRLWRKAFNIYSTLFEAIDAAGLSDELAVQIADIFSAEIDFYRDLREGDRVAAIFEVLYRNGEPVKTGRVLAAELVNKGKTYRAVYFQPGNGRGGYYLPDGRNLHGHPLRSPLEYSRVSSSFAAARFHPILHVWRVHKGIDYAAPVGTRVRATADGVVEFAGRQGSFGNLVILRHPPNCATYYGHLSGFARGMRKGGRVEQGEVIGYVGATGLATGPHLHYEVRVDDVQRDPSPIVASAASITPEEMPVFEKIAGPLVTDLDRLSRTSLAALR